MSNPQQEPSCTASSDQQGALTYCPSVYVVLRPKRLTDSFPIMLCVAAACQPRGHRHSSGICLLKVKLYLFHFASLLCLVICFKLIYFRRPRLLQKAEITCGRCLHDQTQLLSQLFTQSKVVAGRFTTSIFDISSRNSSRRTNTVSDSLLCVPRLTLASMALC